MQLFITPTSPYARLPRIVIREKGIEGVEEVPVTTREPDSPYYDVVPSGRVPALKLDDGTLLEESALICDWLDASDDAPMFARPDGEAYWRFARYEALARGMLDGTAVLIREYKRPENHRSPPTIAHEEARLGRLLGVWEDHVGAPELLGDLNYIQMLLATALQVAEGRLGWTIAQHAPRLSGWLADMVERPSLAATRPY